MINYNTIAQSNNFILLDHFLSLCEERAGFIAVFHRVRHPIAQSYPPAPGCMGFTLYPPWQEGVGGVITSPFTRVKSAIENLRLAFNVIRYIISII